jgi:hypothetical protein
MHASDSQVLGGSILCLCKPSSNKVIVPIQACQINNILRSSGDGVVLFNLGNVFVDLPFLFFHYWLVITSNSVVFARELRPTLALFWRTVSFHGSEA